MSLQSPLYLLTLLAVPPVIAGYVLFQRRRARTAGRFASLDLLPNVVERSPGWRRHLPPAIFLVALAALLVGMARPQAIVSVRREEATVVLAIDTSRSMAATDVAPTRLAAARSAAKRFLEGVPVKYRVGVVAFASQAQVVAPATRDREIVRAALDALRPGEGTALGDAIARATDVGRAVPRALFGMIGDYAGEEKAAAEGPTLFTITCERCRQDYIPLPPKAICPSCGSAAVTVA